MSEPSIQIPVNVHAARHLKRSQIEDLLDFAAFLPPKDRILVEQILDAGLPLSRISKLYRLPPRKMQRQATSIIKRLSQKTFRFVALHMKTLPVEVRPTARYVILNGLSQRETADILGTTLHHIRKHMNTVRSTERLLTK